MAPWREWAISSSISRIPPVAGLPHSTRIARMMAGNPSAADALRVVWMNVLRVRVNAAAI